MLEEKMCTSVRMVFLSNLLESKGILDLLEALALLKQRGCRVVCDVVGAETAEISWTRLQEEIGKRHLEDMVNYLGALYGEAKARELEKAQLFVFPTYYPNECFPLVLLEAMAHGLPCISTNEGAIPDIIDDGKTGLIAEKHNPQDLADKIVLLLNDVTLRKQMGEWGRKKYQQEYTLQRFEQRFVECMNSILSDKQNSNDVEN